MLGYVLLNILLIVIVTDHTYNCDNSRWTTPNTFCSDTEPEEPVRGPSRTAKTSNSEISFRIRWNGNRFTSTWRPERRAAGIIRPGGWLTMRSVSFFFRLLSFLMSYLVVVSQCSYIFLLLLIFFILVL